MPEETKNQEIPPETAERIELITQILSQISEDSTVPRNIRRAANQAIEALHSNIGTPAVRASNAISILDEVSQDPNCPVQARTRIWNAVSQLEMISD